MACAWSANQWRVAFLTQNNNNNNNNSTAQVCSAPGASSEVVFGKPGNDDQKKNSVHYGRVEHLGTGLGNDLEKRVVRLRR